MIEYYFILCLGLLGYGVWIVPLILDFVDQHLLLKSQAAQEHRSKEQRVHCLNVFLRLVRQTKS